MLHIKDIEAFAHINEALAHDSGARRGEDDATGHHPAIHPALLIAMAATGRLTPEEGADGTPQTGNAAAMLARLMGVRRR